LYGVLSILILRYRLIPRKMTYSRGHINSRSCVVVVVPFVVVVVVVVVVCFCLVFFFVIERIVIWRHSPCG
jgi:hypothetical protein